MSLSHHGHALMSERRGSRLFVLLLALIPTASPLFSAGPASPWHVNTSDDALWSIVYQEHRLTLGANGYFVLERNGKVLLDGGCQFLSPDLRAFGMQFRDPDPERAQRERVSAGELRFRGTLLQSAQNAWKPAFEYIETIRPEENGVRFRYDMRPVEPITVGHLGGYVHLPCWRYAGQEVRALPGFSAFALPTQLTPGKLFAQTSRVLLAAPGSELEFAISLPQSSRWWIDDERDFYWAAYRAQFDVPLPNKGQLTPSDSVTFEFELLWRGFVRDVPILDGAGRISFAQNGSYELAYREHRLLQGGLRWEAEGDPTDSLHSCGFLRPPGPEASVRELTKSDEGPGAVRIPLRADGGAIEEKPSASSAVTLSIEPAAHAVRLGYDRETQSETLPRLTTVRLLSGA